MFKLINVKISTVSFCVFDQTRKGGENKDVHGGVSNKRQAVAFQVDFRDIEVKYNKL